MRLSHQERGGAGRWETEVRSHPQILYTWHLAFVYEIHLGPLFSTFCPSSILPPSSIPAISPISLQTDPPMYSEKDWNTDNFQLNTSGTVTSTVIVGAVNQISIHPCELPELHINYGWPSHFNTEVSSGWSLGSCVAIPLHQVTQKYHPTSCLWGFWQTHQSFQTLSSKNQVGHVIENMKATTQALIQEPGWLPFPGPHGSWRPASRWQQLSVRHL